MCLSKYNFFWINCSTILKLKDWKSRPATNKTEKANLFAEMKSLSKNHLISLTIEAGYFMFGNNVESIFVALLQRSGISIDRFTFVRFRAETLKIMSTTNLFLIFL